MYTSLLEYVRQLVGEQVSAHRRARSVLPGGETYAVADRICACPDIERGLIGGTIGGHADIAEVLVEARFEKPSILGFQSLFAARPMTGSRMARVCGVGTYVRGR
jgi:hypothetical protein